MLNEQLIGKNVGEVDLGKILSTAPIFSRMEGHRVRIRNLPNTKQG
jgi:hypothetical protein